MSLKMIVLVLVVIGAVSSAGLAGGLTDANITDEGVQDALQYAMSQYNKQSNDVYVREVSEIIRIQKQVVSGMKYYFTVNVGRTGCRKGQIETLCAVHEDPTVAQVMKCEITVWSQPWMNSISVLKHTCA